MLHISTHINAPKQKVWHAYISPSSITQWNFATTEWHCPASENDVRIGGKFKNRMEAKDGSFGFDFEGEYTHVVDQEALQYVLRDGRKVHISFIEKSDEITKLNIEFDAEKINPEEIQIQGWQAILNNFKKHVETL